MAHNRRAFLRAIGAGGIGAAVASGGTAAAAETITVEGAGADIWNDYDEFHYYYEEVTGDFDVTVRVDSLEDTSEYAKAGLMVRQTLADDEEHAMVRKMPGHDTSFQWRSNSGDQAVSTTSDGGSGESEVSGGTVQAAYQRLVRSGDTIEAYGSTDGSSWTLIADISPGEIDFADSAYVGLAVTSHNTGTLCTAEFSELSGLTPTNNQDVGDVDVAGSVTDDGGTADPAPIVATGSVSNLGTSSVTLTGSLQDLGDAASADVAFEYRQSGASSWSTTGTQARSSTGSFSADVSDLSSETEYEYRAIVTASDGDANVGSIDTFTTNGDSGGGGPITVNGAGADIWNQADEGHYYFTDVRGDFDAVVEVTSVEDTDSWAKAGLMFREFLAADSKNAMVRKTPGNDSSFSWRESTGGTAESTTSDGGDVIRNGGQMAADWQRLVRTGDTIRAYLSTDGSDWTLIAELNASTFSTEGYLGLAVTSANPGTLCASEFTDLAGVTLTNNQDLGNPDVSGSVSGGAGGDDTLPLVSTGSASNVQDASATLSASLDSLGNAASADVSFEYRETGAGSWTATGSQTVSSATAFSIDVSGLSNDTEYEYRAVADASDGDTDVGFVETFTTRPPDTQPIVSTGSASDISSSAATLSGSLDDLGGAFHADVYFEYRESSASSWTETTPQNLDETGSFEQTEFGLASDTSYEFRAALEAEDGDTAAGDVATFSTTEGVSGGSHFDLEDGFADASWFDDSIQVIKVGANYGEIQAALETTGPRLVVFEESGVLDLQNQTLEVTEPNCWVAGQTAPSPGITFTNGFFQVDADDCVVQHVRVFRGDESGGEGTDPMNSADGTQNVIFDHCTAFWGRDENLSIGYDSTNTTLSNCMIAEGLEDPEENSNGTLVGDGADNVAILGTIYAKNNDRNPRLKSDTRTVVVNGLNYYHDKAIWIDESAEASVVGNAYIHRFSFRDPIVFGDGSVHMEDNYVADPPLDGRPFSDVGTELSSPPLWPSGLEALPAGDVESHNKTFAGARPADRIYQEEKIVQQITDRWGSLDVDPNDDNAGYSDIPDSAAEAGGYPDHGGTTRTLDVPDSGLRDWIDQHAVAVETGDGSSGGGGGGGDADPSVTTDSASEIGTSSATLNGSLDGLGGADGVDVSFEWRTTTDDAWTTTGTQALSSTGSFSADVSGLSSGTSYEYRAVANANDGDAATGSTSTFSTSTDTDFSGGAYFDLGDGFASPDWFDDSVDVYRIQNATRSELEDALTASGPRLVVFETSGTISLGGSPLQITNDKCWIAGQTAPSPGITLTEGLFQIDANDCVVQHIRSRVGPGPNGDIQGNDSFNTQDETTNNIFDHCTASWGVDECMSVGYDTDRTTFANCLIYEGLYDPYGDGSDHNYCTLVGDGADHVALLGTVWAKARNRIPRLKSDTRSVVANNFCYFFDEASNVDSSAETTWVGNKYTGLLATGESIVEGSGTVYSEDNITADPPTDSDVSFVEQSTTSSRPLWPSGLSAMSSGDVESHNLNYAGARPADRTGNDSRIIQEIRDRAGNDRLDSEYDYWIADHEEVGGYPSLPENAHTLNVPDAGLRDWLEQWALAVEEEDASPP
ncbi:DUF1349 domain-containing protein [Halosolutus gelatinilyticus]|uniref:DUF1349 domain-containing protein n=1 Tax=Halosolutus gelatinilyticus TaxID=2931975 RepID=UPI001FF44641|nr:DUF1349 domain-containing protein [Halosolutus gelatinilyticus]